MVAANRSATLARAAGVLLVALLILAFGLLPGARSAHAAPLEAVNAAPASAAVIVGGRALVSNTGGDNIRVRSGAGVAFEQVAEAHEGESLTVLAGPSQDRDGRLWYKVQAPGGAGWIAAEFLKPAAPEAPGAGAWPALRGSARVANTDGDPLRVRAAAERGGKVLATLPPGTEVAIKAGPTVDAEGIAWYQVQVLDSGLIGWAMAIYLSSQTAPRQATPAQDSAQRGAASPQPAPETAATGQSQAQAQPPSAEQVGGGAQTPGTPGTLGSQIASIGMQYVGTRYVFGGTSPAGFDCSGFMYYVLNKAGVRAGRTIPAQIESGRRISSDALRPGDLLFWSNTYKPGLSHAGIYVGNGKFVHSENERTGVIVSSMSNPYYASRFTAAVRPGE
jgi:cell wall-associated NlpC family hydrolase